MTKVRFLRPVDIRTSRIHFCYEQGEIADFDAKRAAYHVGNGTCEYVKDDVPVDVEAVPTVPTVPVDVEAVAAAPVDVEAAPAAPVDVEAVPTVPVYVETAPAAPVNPFGPQSVPVNPFASHSVSGRPRGGGRGRHS